MIMFIKHVLILEKKINIYFFFQENKYLQEKYVHLMFTPRHILRVFLCCCCLKPHKSNINTWLQL